MIRKLILANMAAALAIGSLPAAAQQSTGSKFLEAVRNRNGGTATDLLAAPGSTVMSAREAKTGDTALHIVTRARDVNWLRFLLSKGARTDVQNEAGDTPLGLAAQVGWVEGAEILLDRRASVDLANAGGETPLIHAVHRRDLGMVRTLLAAGANPKKSDSKAGYSALDYAKQDRRAAAVLKLLEAGPTGQRAEVAGPKL